MSLYWILFIWIAVNAVFSYGISYGLPRTAEELGLWFTWLNMWSSIYIIGTKWNFQDHGHETEKQFYLSTKAQMRH